VPACSSSPIPAVAQRLVAPAALAPNQCRDLLGYLAQIADPRHRRGRRHPLSTVLAVAVAAVLAGARSLAAIGEWASDAPDRVLAALGVRRDLLTRAWRPPGEATVRRVLARIDADALDRAIGAWLASQQPPPASPPSPTPRPMAAGGRGRRQDPTRQRPPPTPTGAPAGGDGPHQPCGPGPDPGGRQDQRDPRVRHVSTFVRQVPPGITVS
jgi:DDE_Tnp_1-associated